MFEARKVAGSATYKQCETVSLEVSLFIQIIQSWKQREFVYSICLRIKIKMSNLHSAALIK